MKTHNYSLACLVALCTMAMTPACALAEFYKAKVVSVIDGDSMKIVKENGTKQTIILYGVDCPELGQDFGAEAKKFTDDCCYGKSVTIEERGKDRHQRVVADVSLSDGSNLGHELVRRGLAWWSDKFAKNDAQLKQYHTAAKEAKKGLWSAPNPIPPWIFRNGSKDVQAEIKVK